MYKVIGTDGKEYGPVSADQIHQWLEEGRVNAQTKAQIEGSGEWKLLANIPGFEPATNKGAPPPLTAAPAATPAATAREVSSKTSGLAVASLILGVLGFCGVTALAGLILGIIATVKINRSQGRLSGNGLAIAGICVSGFMLLFAIPFMAGLTLPALAKGRQRAQTIACMNTARQLALAVKMYVDDNKNQYPPAEAWCDILTPYVGSKNAFQCPAGDPGERCHYALNARLKGLANNPEAAPSIVLIFETDGGWNLSGGPELMPGHSRHGNGVVVAFADGHAEVVPGSRLGSLRWDP